MLKDLFRHSAVYGIGNALTNAAGFFLLPLYTSYLSIREYGLLEVFFVSMMILIRLLQLGFGSGLFRYYSYSSSLATKNTKNKLLVSSSFYFITAFAGACIVLLLIFREKLSFLLFGAGSYKPLLSLMLLAVFFSILPVIPRAQLRAENKSLIFSALSFVQFIVQVSLAIILVAFLRMNIDGVLIARLGSACVAGLFFVWTVRSQIQLRFALSAVKEMLSYSIYLVPVSIGSMILMLSNRYFILSLRGIEELGVFSVGNRIASVMLLAVTAFQLAWPSIMFRVKDSHDARHFYSKVFTYYVLAFGLIVLGLVFFSKELVLLMSHEGYLGAAPLIPLLGMGYFFYGLFYAGIVGITIFNKTYYQAIAVSAGAVTNIILNYVLTPVYGNYGVVASLILSYIVLAMLAITFSQKIYKIRFEVYRLIRVIVVLSGVAILHFFTLQGSSLSLTFTKMLVLFVVVPSGLYLFGFWTDVELSYLSTVFRRFRPKGKR